MMPPSKVLPFGAPYRPLDVLTVFLKSEVRSFTQGWSVSGCSVWSGCRAWNRDPVLYRNTSSIVPVDSRVLTRLSPSVPPGRVSTLTVIVGFAWWKAVARSFANFVAAGSFPPAIKEMVVGPLLALFALDEQAARPTATSARGTSAATAVSRRSECLDAGLIRVSCRVAECESGRKGVWDRGATIKFARSESFQILEAP